jgi:hypothetical protein
MSAGENPDFRKEREKWARPPNHPFTPAAQAMSSEGPSTNVQIIAR